MKVIKKIVIIFTALLLILTIFSTALPQRSLIILNSDDGTEVNITTWYENGYNSSLNYLGTYQGTNCGTGLRYHVNDLNQGEEITYARLRFSSQGSEITSSLKLLVEGVMQNSPTSFNQTERPSQKQPKTNSKIIWDINEDWSEGHNYNCFPMYYSTPDISPIINEILSLPNWGSGSEGKTMIFTVNNFLLTPIMNANYVKFNDLTNGNIKHPTLLEVYKNVYDTFIGKELLGRITDKSVTVNLYSLIDTDTYIEYGTEPGKYTHKTPKYLNQPAEQPIEIILEDLKPDTEYYYRLAYRKTGTRIYEKAEEHAFHTQRPKGSTFSFAMTADDHLIDKYAWNVNHDAIELYNITLRNIENNRPDFFIPLGDFVSTQQYNINAKNVIDAKERYLIQRKHIDEICHSIPFYLAIGNHEGEQGWFYYSKNDNADNLATRSLKARKEIIPNPYPDDFYSGNTDPMPGVGLREDYFAWEWGDALFVVLDPFHYTKNKPMKTHNGWDWTLGEQQYNWLYDTLHNSTAKWKFIFTHHLTTTTVVPWMGDRALTHYGRGGIEVVKHKVEGWPTFEWGGENGNGDYIFDTMRPGWNHGPIHDFLVAENVTMVLHGHDHLFAKQDLDGIVYLECPVPTDPNYGAGNVQQGLYSHGDILKNSGHVQVTVNSDDVKLEYIRAYLPGDGVNGEIAYTYTIQ